MKYLKIVLAIAFILMFAMPTVLAATVTTGATSLVTDGGVSESTAAGIAEDDSVVNAQTHTSASLGSKSIGDTLVIAKNGGTGDGINIVNTVKDSIGTGIVKTDVNGPGTGSSYSNIVATEGSNVNGFTRAQTDGSGASDSQTLLNGHGPNTLVTTTTEADSLGGGNARSSMQGNALDSRIYGAVMTIETHKGNAVATVEETGINNATVNGQAFANTDNGDAQAAALLKANKAITYGTSTATAYQNGTALSGVAGDASNGSISTETANALTNGPYITHALSGSVSSGPGNSAESLTNAVRTSAPSGSASANGNANTLDDTPASANSHTSVFGNISIAEAFANASASISNIMATLHSTLGI